MIYHEERIVAKRLMNEMTLNRESAQTAYDSANCVQEIMIRKRR